MTATRFQMPAVDTGLVLPFSYTAVGPIDATGEKIAIIGSVWNAARATKDIRKVHFRFGTVVKAGGSGLTVSLQNVDLATGPPFQPDGTQDQTVAIANGDAAFASATWYTTGNLSADRTVAFGERLAVVIEYDGSGRLGADSVNLSAIGHTGMASLTSGFSLFTASWAAVASVISNVLLEFSDGSFGYLDRAFPASAISTVAFNSGSAADEIALAFQVPFACKCDGAWMAVNAAGATSDFDIVLYEGTTAVGTFSVDANAIRAAAVGRFVYASWPEVSLAVGTQYYLALKPTTANNVTGQLFDVASAGHWAAHEGDTAFAYSTRVDAGSWAAITTTRRLFAGIRISDITASSSGGLIRHPGMAGGLAA